MKPISFNLPKKKGGKREIIIPTNEEVLLQNKIMKQIRKKTESQFVDWSFAFIRGRGPNVARNHIIKSIDEGYSHVAIIDIVNCFTNIHPRHAFSLLDPPHNNSLVLDGYDCLPQGHPISPFLCNLYLNQFDQEIQAYLPLDLKAIRYADDIWLLSHKRKVVKHYASMAIDILERLKLNCRYEIRHVNQGIPFLGFTVTRGSIRPSHESQQRLLEKLSRLIIHHLRSMSGETPTSQSTPAISPYQKIMNLKQGWTSYYGNEAWIQTLTKRPLLLTWLAELGIEASSANSGINYPRRTPI